ncbi:MAG TPA: hypothetical protein PLI09_04495 [Candidatus Hydrogenedentes bacterium]|nr:hypothetical protein [Candidatus Hydrogenedentota bacterium]
MSNTAGHMRVILGMAGVLFLLLIWLPSLGTLETLSLRVIGEPPINGESWMAGVEALGGSFSMRLAATLGMIILLLGAGSLLSMPNIEIPSRRVGRNEILAFFGITMLFGAGNFYIGYAWWDPEAFLGMGPYFAHSMVLLLGLGLAPHAAARVFGCTPALANRHDGAVKFLLPVLLTAFGYGLVSCLWHCCCFFSWTIVFFFVVIKGVQLWAVCRFFYGWGLKMLIQAWGKRWAAYGLISVLFGFCYPWHTVGFAVAFILFGFLLCATTFKADSYLIGWSLLYFSYLFHAGLPWHGPVITQFVLFPLALLVLVLGMWRVMRRNRSNQPSAQ